MVPLITAVTALLIIALLIYWLYSLHYQENPQTCKISKYLKSPDRLGTFVWNIKTGTNSYSKELRNIYQITSDDQEHINYFMSLLHPLDKEATQKSIDKAFTTGKYKAAFRVVLPNKKIRFIAACGTVIYDENKKPILLAGFNIDITPKY
ncbi:MAG: response regulator [Hyperionvirus sp.]|uniref:histidine kinase n=1 Tax=Hyperionvirus sp. TaxID=2487770 RepID=A0A3G5AEE9_9VIRU|nr:MAG: response regulator [Hyperionvirus sp.]